MKRLWVSIVLLALMLAVALGKSSTLAAVAVNDENLCRVVKTALDALNDQTEQ